MLYALGIAIEKLNFQQLSPGLYTATFIRGSNSARAECAMGWSPDATVSSDVRVGHGDMPEVSVGLCCCPVPGPAVVEAGLVAAGAGD
jgi:hypothetical protein